LTERLYLQDQVTTKYGYRAYRKQQEATREASREKEQALESEKMTAWQGENTGLLEKAKDNLSRGQINPTNPVKETISSYQNQSHRSTLKRPLEDSDVLKGPGGEKY
jgi:DNA polymerase/3'-5' exonuclease PolX